MCAPWLRVTPNAKQTMHHATAKPSTARIQAVRTARPADLRTQCWEVASQSISPLVHYEVNAVSLALRSCEDLRSGLPRIPGRGKPCAQQDERVEGALVAPRRSIAPGVCRQHHAEMPTVARRRNFPHAATREETSTPKSLERGDKHKRGVDLLTRGDLQTHKSFER